MPSGESERVPSTEGTWVPSGEDGEVLATRGGFGVLSPAKYKNDK